MVEYLKSLDLHDTPINAIQIDFYNEVLNLIVRHYDEEKKDYFEIKLVFFGVKDLQLEKTDIISQSEITHLDIEELPNGCSAEFVLLCNEPWYSVKLVFGFSKVVVDYPADRKPHLQ